MAAAATSESNSGHLPPNAPPSGSARPARVRCGIPSALATSFRAPNSDCVEVSITSASSSSSQAGADLWLEVALVDPAVANRPSRTAAAPSRPPRRRRRGSDSGRMTFGREVLGLDRVVAAADAGVGLGVHRARPIALLGELEARERRRRVHRGLGVEDDRQRLEVDTTSSAASAAASDSGRRRARRAGREDDLGRGERHAQAVRALRADRAGRPR